MSLPVEYVETDENRRRSWLQPAITAILVVIAGTAGVLELLPANYYVLLPGQAQLVEPMISVQGHPPIHARGKLLMTDVSVEKVNHVLEELYWRVHPDAELDPAQDVAGNLSEQQYIAVNDEMMQDSIHKAEVAALEVTQGYKLHFTSSGPEILAVFSGMPASGHLKVGDIVKSVDGHRTRRADDVAPLTRGHKPGTIVHLAILRNGRLLHISLRTAPSGTGKAASKTSLIGIVVQDQIALPMKIHVDPGNIGGPSAGLMFSLGIIQRVERRDITRGCPVAGTGEINWDGSVGAIGGARQKVVAARQAGARYFLVPDVPDNVNPATAGRGSITVVPVKNVRQALQFLNRLKPCR